MNDGQVKNSHPKTGSTEVHCWKEALKQQGLLFQISATGVAGDSFDKGLPLESRAHPTLLRSLYTPIAKCFILSPLVKTFKFRDPLPLPPNPRHGPQAHHKSQIPPATGLVREDSPLGHVKRSGFKVICMFVLLSGSAISICVKLSNHKGKYENGQMGHTMGKVLKLQMRFAYLWIPQKDLSTVYREKTI